MLITETPKLVAVMGDTGAGKSSFIKLVTGNDKVKVGGSLRSSKLLALLCSRVIEADPISQ